MSEYYPEPVPKFDPTIIKFGVALVRDRESAPRERIIQASNQTLDELLKTRDLPAAKDASTVEQAAVRLLATKLPKMNTRQEFDEESVAPAGQSFPMVNIMAVDLKLMSPAQRSAFYEALQEKVLDDSADSDQEYEAITDVYNKLFSS
jgi:hypothetical protein